MALSTNSATKSTGQDALDSAPLYGLDIGTGASCIFPLLGTSLHSHWNFLATEIDPISYAAAVENVERNSKISSRIQMIKASTYNYFDDALKVDDKTVLMFSMCNPPFFASKDEADTNPSKCCMGSMQEMVYESGGEIGFVGRMIEQSVSYRRRCVWFTSMIGRKSSLRKLIAMLRSLEEVTYYCTTEFCQGRTKRWGMAWTFSDLLKDANATQMIAGGKVLGKRKERQRKHSATFDVLNTASGMSRARLIF